MNETSTIGVTRDAKRTRIIVNDAGHMQWMLIRNELVPHLIEALRATRASHDGCYFCVLCAMPGDMYLPTRPNEPQSQKDAGK